MSEYVELRLSRVSNVGLKMRAWQAVPLGIIFSVGVWTTVRTFVDGVMQAYYGPSEDLLNELQERSKVLTDTNSECVSNVIVAEAARAAAAAKATALEAEAEALVSGINEGIAKAEVEIVKREYEAETSKYQEKVETLQGEIEELKERKSEWIENHRLAVEECDTNTRFITEKHQEEVQVLQADVKELTEAKAECIGNAETAAEICKSDASIAESKYQEEVERLQGDVGDLTDAKAECTENANVAAGTYETAASKYQEEARVLQGQLAHNKKLSDAICRLKLLDEQGKCSAEAARVKVAHDLQAQSLQNEVQDLRKVVLDLQGEQNVIGLLGELGTLFTGGEADSGD